MSQRYTAFEISHNTWKKDKKRHMILSEQYHEGYIKILYKREAKINVNDVTSIFYINNQIIRITKARCWCCEKKRYINDFPKVGRIYAIDKHGYGNDNVYPEKIRHGLVICNICVKELRSINTGAITNQEKILLLHKDNELRLQFKEAVNLKELKEYKRKNKLTKI